MACSEPLGTVHEVTLPAGRIRYHERGQGPPVVFVHGLLVNADLWRAVVPPVAAAGYRCIAPDWPLGAHELPVPDADLSPPGVAALLAAFLDRLDLDDVTVVANDTGGAITKLLITRHPERVGRVVLTPSDSLERFFPPAFVDSYLLPSRRDRAVRRDLRRFLRGVHHRHTLVAARSLPQFTKPVLLAWAAEDRLFPLELAHRLAALLPHATVVTIPDSYTFVPEDQPELLARLVVDFARAHATQATA